MNQSTNRFRNLNNPKSFRESKLYHKWYKSVATGKPNDFVIAITAHPGKTSTSGTGKSMFSLDLAYNYFHHGSQWDADQHYTLDIEQLAYEMYPNASELDCYVGDEMQGTVASSNFNKKRSMKEENLDAYNAIAGGRKERITVILVFQTLKQVQKDLFDFVDAWLLIVDDVNYRANHYSVVPDVFDLKNDDLKTPFVESICWNSLGNDHPEYQKMEQKKDRANAGEKEYEDEDEDDEMPKEMQARYAKRIKEAEDCAWRDVTKYDDGNVLTYSGGYLRRVYKDVATDVKNHKTAEG